MTRTRKTLFRASIVPALMFVLGVSSGRAEAGPCEAEPTDMSVDYGELVSCEIAPGADTDLYRFSGVAGDRVLVEALFVSGSSFVPRISVIAPNSTVLFDNYNPARANLVLPQTGTYTVIVGSHTASWPGEYAFTVSCTSGTCVPNQPPPPPPPPGADVSCEPEPTDFFPHYGTRVTCDISPGADTDLYRFFGNTGDRILAEALFVSGTSFVPRVMVIAPDSTVLYDNYNPARADLVLPQTGIYTAIVGSHTASWSGEYTFTVSCTAGKCLSPLAAPTVSFTLTGCTVCQAGQQFTVSAHWRNPGTTAVRAELKIGFRAPSGTTSNSLGNKHFEFTFPAGFNTTANLISIPWPAGQPAGMWSIEAVLLAPDLGETYAREVDFFTVAP